MQKIIADLESAIAQEKKVSTAPPQGTIINDGKSGSAGTATTTVVAAAPAKAEKPLWKRAWLWGVVGGVVAAGIIIGVGVGVGTEPHSPHADGSVTF